MKFSEVRKKMPGGYRFNLAGKPQDIVADLGIPAKAYIPLGEQSGQQVRPIVSVGEQVRAGQIIGRDEQGVLSPAYASVNGTIEGFSKLKAIRGGVREVAVIATDVDSSWEPLPGGGPNWQEMAQEDLEAYLHTAGVLSLVLKTPSVASGEITDLIIQGIGDIPYDLSLELSLAENNRAGFLEGVKILKALLPQANLHLAVSSERERLIREVFAGVKGLDWLNLYSLSPKYPQSSAAVLIPSILGEEGRRAKKAVIIPVTTVLHVYEAVVQGKPLIERIVALGGLGWKENLLLRVRLGTPLQDITRSYLQGQGHYRLVPNNLLLNGAVSDLDSFLDASLFSLAAIPEGQPQANGKSSLQHFASALSSAGERGCNTSQHGEIGPCIFCGFCDQVCPAGLLPQLLEKYVKRDLVGEELVRYGIFDCLECNLCTFVCPSKIPVAGLIKLGKKKLVEEGHAGAEKGLVDRDQAG